MMKLSSVHLASALLLASCSSAPVNAWKSMLNCYDGLNWYSWGSSHQQIEVVQSGPAYRDGDDVSAVVLFDEKVSQRGVTQGFYLFTNESARWYPFPALPDPSISHDFLLRFTSDSMERKIWIRYSRPGAESPKLEILGSWPYDIRVIELAGTDLELSVARDVFVPEVVRQIQATKTTYDRQNELYHLRAPSATSPLDDRGFVQKLRACGKVPDPKIQSAVRAMSAEFREKTPARAPAPKSGS